VAVAAALAVQRSSVQMVLLALEQSLGLAVPVRPVSVRWTKRLCLLVHFLDFCLCCAVPEALCHQTFACVS
jgi:hypothetical protein